MGMSETASMNTTAENRVNTGAVPVQNPISI